MLVGEAPGYDEDRDGVPFVGQAGKLLNHVLGRLGVRRDDLYVTNVIKCRPPDNKLPGKKDLMVCWEQCREYFIEELSKIKPKVVVLMGGTPLQLVMNYTGITKHEGMVVDNHDVFRGPFKSVVWVAAFHPAYVLRSPGKEVRLAQALARAFKLGGVKIKVKKEMEMFAYDVRS
jgi:DNA polymerase